jgi:RNA polymerase sigma-70 factor (ECF subfamily)
MILVESRFAGEIIPPAFVNSPIEIIATMASEQNQPPDVPALTARMSRGEEAAFHEFNRLYFNRLLRYLFVVAGGREEVAREALQLAFVRVARHVRRFDSEAAFWNWLAMLARNCVTDEMRKRNRYQSLLARFFQQQPAVADWRGNEAGERLEELLQQGLVGLPADERALLERKYLNGEPVRGLAVEWKMTEKAMESHLFRIRRKLKTAMVGRLRNETNL